MKKVDLIEIQHIWSVLCTSSSVDQTTQNISLFGVLEQLNVNEREIKSQKPSKNGSVGVAFPFQMVNLFRKVGNPPFIGDLLIEIIDPNNKIIASGGAEIKIDESGKDRLRVINSFAGIPVTLPGYYNFAVSTRPKGGDYERVCEIPLRVKFN